MAKKNTVRQREVQVDSTATPVEDWCYQITVAEFPTYRQVVHFPGFAQAQTAEKFKAQFAEDHRRRVRREKVRRYERYCAYVKKRKRAKYWNMGSAIILVWLAFKFLQYYGHG
jgi:hypothetical protein